MRKWHDNKIAVWVCNALIATQFALCVTQMAAVNAFEQCLRYDAEDSIMRDPWMGCEVFKWYNNKPNGK